MPPAPQESPQPIAPIRRRWFRVAFSLRTLLLLFAVLAVPLGWLAWQVQIVRERKAILSEIRQASQDEAYIDTREEWDVPENGNQYKEYVRVSRVRQLLGDTSVLTISFPSTLDPRLIERIENAFPDACLYTENAYRDAINKPESERTQNEGSLFKTGLFAKP